MENFNTPPATPKEMANIYGVHLGKIFSNLSIALAIICIASFMSMLISVLLWVLGFFMIIISIGTIFIVFPNYLDMLKSSSNTIGNITNFLIKVFPIIIPITILLAVLSIIFLSFDKNCKHIVRLIFSSLIIAGSIFLIIFFVLGA